MYLFSILQTFQIQMVYPEVKSVKIKPNFLSILIIVLYRFPFVTVEAIFFNKIVFI